MVPVSLGRDGLIVVVQVVVFHGVGCHIGENAGDVVVGCFVEDLLVLAGAAHKARGAQEAQVVADQRLGCASGFGDVADRDGPFKADEQNAQPCGVTHQLIGFSDQRDSVVVGEGQGWFHSA